MLKKFRDGFVFGLGFSLACLLVAYFSIVRNDPMVVDSQDLTSDNTNQSKYNAIQGVAAANSFHELPIEDKIEKASAIAVARFEEAPDGKMKAIIKEFLKKEEGTTIYYGVGDEFASSSYYPEENVRYGEGVIIFFTGSPASMRMSMTYSGDRIKSLGDMPMALFREKCRDVEAQDGY